MRIDDFIARLQKVSKDARGYKACCPAHEDHNPSLSVSEADGGKILVKCWAGCTAESIVASMGLKLADLMGEAKRDEAENRNKRGVAKPRGKIVAIYDYRAADGKLLFQVCRMDPKSFSQRVPDPEHEGQFRWGRSRYGVGEVLYRLPQLLEACKAGKVVLVCEGEKDVEAWERLGVHATCNPGGAGKWRREFGKCFQGAKLVVVIADNDPAPVVDPDPRKSKDGWQGQRHADDVRRMLELDGIKVVALTLPPIEGKDLKDSADWIAAGGNAERLKAAIKSAPPWPPNYLAVKPVGVEPTATQSSSGEGRRGAARVALYAEKTLAHNIAHNLYEASKDGDGRTRQLGATERREIVAQTVMGWLLDRGRFFYHGELRDHARNMFFDGKVNELMLVESDRFQSWLAIESGQNRTNKDFTFFHAAVHDAALCGEKTRGIIPESYWARRGDTIYLSQGDGMMVRISAAGCDQVPNGTDDVLFSVGKTLRPWQLLKRGDERDPFDVCRLFREMACISGYGRMLVRLWMLGIAAGHTCKPPLVLAGGVGSGKTRTAVGIFQIFGIDPRISSVAENGEENFWTSLDQGGLVCFDNADTRVRWLPDAMAAASTDGTHEKRRMYSDSDLIQQHARAWAVITSANATFAADAGLADRLIVVRLDRRTKDTAESALTTEIEENRNACLSWICRTLQAALADKSPATPSINRRHPDWASFALRCGRALGMEADAVQALTDAETDKSRFNVENDPIGSMIMQLLAIRESFDGTVSDLVQQLEAHVDGFERHVWTPIRIGRRLEKIWPHMEAVFKARKGISSGHTVYKLVGMVGVESRFDLQCAKQISQDFIQSTPQLPPSPPLGAIYGEDEEEIPF